MTTPTDRTAYTLWACQACTVVEVNGDTSGFTDEELSDWEDNRAANMPVGLHLTVGRRHGEEHCGEDHDEEDYDGMSACEEREFSWSQCDLCGSRLGGYRRAFTYWGNED